MYTYPDVYCSIIPGGHDTETTTVSFARWLGEEDVVHVNNGLLLSHKKRHASLETEVLY